MSSKMLHDIYPYIYITYLHITCLHITCLHITKRTYVLRDNIHVSIEYRIYKNSWNISVTFIYVLNNTHTYYYMCMLLWISHKVIFNYCSVLIVCFILTEGFAITHSSMFATHSTNNNTYLYSDFLWNNSKRCVTYIYVAYI